MYLFILIVHIYLFCVFHLVSLYNYLLKENQNAFWFRTQLIYINNTNVHCEFWKLMAHRSTDNFKDLLKSTFKAIFKH